MRTLLICGLLFVGCASTRHIHLPDGRTGTMVACSGRERDWGDCMNQAHDVCSGGYTIVERYGERYRGMRKARETDLRDGARSVERKMLVTCGR